MRQTDSQLSMLSYWVEDKGIETAFTDYYPNLAQSDPVIREALFHRRAAEAVLEKRIKEITDQAGDDDAD
jgi:hypothetical protein